MTAEMTAAALPSVGFIGLGDQGLPMAVAIAEAGYPLQAWARRPSSLEALASVPHARHENIADLAAASDIVALCVSTDEDVVALVTGGLLSGLRPGSVVVNHGTGTPGNAVRLAGICAAAGVEALDAPVSGGRMGAESRTLTTMVGGPELAARRCEPVFQSFSKHISYLGGPGTGQTAKLLNNMLMAMNHASIADILEIAVRLGADPVRLAEVLRQGSAASTALALLPLNSGVDPDAPGLRAPLQYLILDMELFDAAMTESGVDAGSVTARGLSGANRVPEVIRTLNPRPVAEAAG
jgi:3-hydroxyisobutyrate dehydrogenase-like beta-hydroxyacid dehydrogenase